MTKAAAETGESNGGGIDALLYPGATVQVGVAGVAEVRVERILGVGTFAVVCRVTDTATGASYALKVLKDVRADDPESKEISLVERIRREAAVSIPSRHVVQALGLSEWDANTYLILFEFFEGRPLADLIAFGPEGLTAEDRRTLFFQILQGVADAHRANVIHRDLKPENVLVDRDGDVRVIDFGLARFGDERITVAGATFGTPHYMAPEVIAHGARRADARADIYALGHMLYELSMHEHHWRRRGWGMLDFYKYLTTNPPPAVAADLSDFECPPFPEAGRAVVERMLRVDPAERYASVREVMADLGYAPDDVPTRKVSAPAVAAVLGVRFLVEAGANQGRAAEVVLSDGESRTLGRADFAADREGADLSVSRRHLEVKRAGGRLLVRDAGSRNGTLVNGVRLSSDGWAELADGDHVRVGDLFLRCAAAAANG
jgi:serine/threonine-protein kinase